MAQNVLSLSSGQCAAGRGATALRAPRTLGGRNLLPNVLDVDGDARIEGLRGDEHRLPVLVYFDLIAGLASAAQLFLQRAMVEAGVLYGFVADRTATIHFAPAAGTQLLSRTMAGVLQAAVVIIIGALLEALEQAGRSAGGAA